MTKDKISKLREAYLTSTRAKGRTDGEEVWQGYMDRWDVVSRQAAADQSLVQAFLTVYGTEPQALRAVNVIAQRWGGQAVVDARATHDAPSALMH